MPPGCFVQEMITKLSSKMTTDGMTDVVNHITVFRDEKRTAEERIATAKANASNVQAKQRANKKKLAKQKKVSHGWLNVPAYIFVIFTSPEDCCLARLPTVLRSVANCG